MANVRKIFYTSLISFQHSQVSFRFCLINNAQINKR